MYAEAAAADEGPAAAKQLPPELVYATVHKTRQGDRVVKVEARRVFGAVRGLAAALCWAVLAVVNTVFVERSNGTDRLRDSRKVRKTYRLSKGWGVHAARSYFTLYSSSFCWAVRTLRAGTAPRRYRQRTPAMAAGLAEHGWSLEEWLRFPSNKRDKLPHSKSKELSNIGGTPPASPALSPR